jgi:CIC family chloride channel protein
MSDPPEKPGAPVPPANGPASFLRSQSANISSLIVHLYPRGAVRTFLVSAVVGVISGLGALAFFYMLELTTHLCFTRAAGMPRKAPAGEVIFKEPETATPRPFIFFLLPVIGGLASGLIVYHWAPEAEGHGTDAMIDAFHNKRGAVRTRVPLVKAAATLFTLGLGGSAGREGPIAQIGAGFGSWAATKLGLSASEKRRLLLAGTAGGLGAIFRSPLGGALVSVEVLYKEDFETDALASCIISSVTGYAVFSSVAGTHPIFEIPKMTFSVSPELFLYALLGLVCVPIGILYIKLFYGIRDRIFRPLPIPPHVKPMLGGIGIGLIGLLYPEVYGAGWGQIQLALNGHLAVKLMAAVVLFKILATSLTISSGGSGGVFGPTLFIGGMIGGVVGCVSQHYLPSLVDSPGPFVLVGMASFFAGVAKAPLGALLMVCEMTQGYALLVPLLLVSMVAILLSGHHSIYEKQVLNKFHSPAHAGHFTLNVLEEMRVGDVYNKSRQFTPVHEGMLFPDFRDLVTHTDENYFPVVNEAGLLTGIVRLERMRSAVFHQELDDLVVVQDLAIPLFYLTPEDTLHEALVKFLESDFGELLVTDGADPPKLLGSLTHEDLIAAYHREILARRGMSEGE